MGTTIPASKTCSSRWSMSRPPPHELGRSAYLVCPARTPAGMARMARDDDGWTSRAKTRRGHRTDCLCRDHAPAGLCRDRPVCGSAGAARQTLPHRHHLDHLAGLGPDAVAGDRIRDAGVLRARRSRSDHVVAGHSGERVFGSHRGDRAVGDSMALLLSTPFVDVLVIGGGIRWFAAYGVVVAIGLSAAAVAIAVTIMLFRLI